jgi:hypothetical protein
VACLFLSIDKSIISTRIIIILFHKEDSMSERQQSETSIPGYYKAGGIAMGRAFSPGWSFNDDDVPTGHNVYLKDPLNGELIPVKISGTGPLPSCHMEELDRAKIVPFMKYDLVAIPAML